MNSTCIYCQYNLRFTWHLVLLSLCLFLCVSLYLQDIHKSYLRTVPPYSHQAYVWADIVDYFEWKEVVVLTSNDQDGRSILTLLRRTLENHDMYKFKVGIIFIISITFIEGQWHLTEDALVIHLINNLLSSNKKRFFFRWF